MKKTLLALAVATFATSASAETIFEKEGTKVDFSGSIRVILDNQTTKENGETVRDGNNGHSNLRNNGTRFGLNITHALNDNGYYALGNLQARLKDDSSAGFGTLYAHQAFVGLGKTGYGQMTFGKQAVIADDVGLANDYEYGLLSDYVPTSSTNAIRYDYTAIEGLTLSANYNFGQKAEEDGTELDTEIKNGYAFGGVYEANNWIFQGVYGRTNYKSATSAKHRADAFDAAVGYNVSDALLVGIDGGYQVEKLGSSKDKSFYVGPMAKFQVTDKSSVYGNYVYGQTKFKDGSREKGHGFLAGTDYQFHKHVVAYVEGKYTRARAYDAQGTRGDKTTERAIGVGMRVFW